MISRVLILLLFVLLGFALGLLFSDLLEWEKFIGAIAISVSALCATVIATANIKQSRKHETIKRTMDAINNKPQQSKELGVLRNRMNSIICKSELWDKPLTHEHLAPVIAKLKLGESILAREWLMYLKNLAIGVDAGLYDKELIEQHLGYLPLNVWRDFWPIAKHQEIQLAIANDTFHSCAYKEYEVVENWVTKLANGTDITRQKPAKEYNEIDHLLEAS
ncbi:hypothetical protein P0F20_003182 [Vibrio metschnikovii]|uniref:DUF4760 domain-containing protein n=1 Tax=Vibrio cincinnatiensis DSM 19608 TaxID=1123491 RepID=A0A1T4SJR7_VIBCI|nr:MULTISPECIES: hypothetical protein [Vibrio]EKK9988586.1 hypothetical protein [Vibrio vulnificus]EKO3774589.1 hypothetical protein [Vibrio metschnikovii]SKA28426.1 hypothetical protein SAMN02745782_03336 [Vibrio cincinnatiensis DSM 19608]SUP05806.1 Uncharacterised protein [Vibrio cincinnatiensis]HAS8600417.1 hypothetical protein [Vibrio vulnificus]